MPDLTIDRILADYERLDGFADAVRLRRYDDLGKAPDAAPPRFDAYVPLLRRLAG